MTQIETPDEQAYRHPWLGVEVRHLATLIAVARTRSFRQAARELGYVQSAVSQQVLRLEHVVGARLVERERGQRTVRLTPVGELLVERGERIVRELQAARIDLSHDGEGAARPLRLAVACDVAPVLARLLATVTDRLPAARIRVLEVATGAELVDMLERGAADVAIGAPMAATGIETLMLAQDPFVVLAPAGSPVARLTTVAGAADLAGERLIVPSSALPESHLRSPGLLLERALQVPVAAAVRGLVAQGHGLGLLPRSAAGPADATIAVIPTSGVIAPRRLALGWHAARRRTAQLAAFCDAAIRAFSHDRTGDHETVLAA